VSVVRRLSIGLLHLFYFLSRTDRPILTNDAKKGVKIVQMKDNSLPQGEIIVKEVF
jgi:hypothetical protein